MHFAPDDDGQGLRRGQLCWKVAYSFRRPNKDNNFRFTDKEIEMLQEEYPHFLVDGGDPVLFCHEFFQAEVKELEGLFSRLEGK